MRATRIMTSDKANSLEDDVFADMLETLPMTLLWKIAHISEQRLRAEAMAP